MKKSILITLTTVLMFLSGCAVSQNYGDDAEENQRQTLVINSSFDEVFRTSVQVALNHKWKIETSDATAGFFSGTTPKSMRAWEDDVSVSFSENEDETITITVDSNLGQRPNRRIVSEFLTEVQSRFE